MARLLKRVSPEVDAQITEARLLIRYHPDLRFYYQATLYLNPFEAMPEECPTAGVDACGNLAINPEFWAGLDPVERCLVLEEEAEHLLKRHMGRLKFMPHLIVNVVADIQIHDLWEKYKLGSRLLKLGWCSQTVKEKYGFRFSRSPIEMSIEEMAAELPDNMLDDLLKGQEKLVVFGQMMPEAEGGSGDGEDQAQGNGAGSQPASEEGDAAGTVAAQPMPDWEQVLGECYQDYKSTSRGDVPYGVPRPLVYRAPKHDFTDYLHWWTGNALSSRLAYTTPSRRFGWMERPDIGIIMPGRAWDGASFAALLDTSGSTTVRMSEHWLSELKNVQDTLQCRIRLFIIDAAIHAEYDLLPGDDWPEVAEGGGGTSFISVYEILRDDKPDGLIQMTDCITDWPTPEDDYYPDYPVLTIATDNGKCSFGETIDVGNFDTDD